MKMINCSVQVHEGGGIEFEEGDVIVGNHFDYGEAHKIEVHKMPTIMMPMGEEGYQTTCEHCREPYKEYEDYPGCCSSCHAPPSTPNYIMYDDGKWTATTFERLTSWTI